MTLDQAIRLIGSRNKIAKLLGVSRQNVTRWQYGIPMARQFQIELLTQGKLKVDPNGFKRAAKLRKQA